MKLKPMRYKDYVWPHNPKVYEITYHRDIAVEKVPFGRYVMQDLGMTYRVLRGEGEFAGEGAYEEFKKLATVFYGEEPGELWHPVWQLTRAYFVSLSLKQEPKADFVSYTFEFWEVYEGQATEPVKAAEGSEESGSAAEVKSSTEQMVYTVKTGDTLWSIAKRYGVTLQELIGANSGIKNPNLIKTGDKITIPEVNE